MVLEHRALLDAPFARIAAVRCAGLDSPSEEVSAAAVVLVRAGVFRRRCDGRAALADVTTGYLQRPGETQQVDHPAGGDVCTSIGVAEELADRFAHAGRVVVPPAADLLHRRLLAAAPPDRADLAGDLLAALLPASSINSPAVEQARLMLNAAPSTPLAELAAAAGCSPWHLSRSFHRVAGITIGTYRRRLRVRAALDEIAGHADADLAAVAVRHGFADQSHMTRSVRAETGRTPGSLASSMN
ncbi:helix-turn-helix domain-containing protein [Paractinoplanes deccanensis]|uniref:helix-turn-helix domain-containing protein n=1 Tax=Paractinoplanes deccanensis TaxID=113561 RepID=UPI001EF29BF3|nr:helix-turn-helix domain-containing protein [Actinoplanes deccanensis]